VIQTFYVPNGSGDYRLEADPAGSVLSVSDPTASEKARIRAFLADARKNGWVDDLDGVMPVGESRLLIKASVPEAGRLLVSKAFEGDDRKGWLAVRSTNGKVRVEVDGNLTALKEPKPDDEAAVAVREVRRGCPPPVPCNRRASEVLRAFSTPAQIAEWQETATMLLTGNISGRRYRLYHRDEAARRGLRHTLLTAEGGEVCVWDNTVPAEEEALAIKFCVEHHEGFIHANGGGGIEGGLLDGVRRGQRVNAGRTVWRTPRQVS
jgi:hypothetical protein